MLALLFPGQGTQSVGMLSPFVSAFESAQRIVNEIEDAVSFRISGLIESGPLEELTKTANAQLAIFTVSMAALSVLTCEFGFNLQNSCKYAAGHSLGELSAICAAGALDVRQMARLVKARGEAMQYCCEDPSAFAMAAVLKVSVDDVTPLVQRYCGGGCFCAIANDNSIGQVVISGHKSAVEQVAARCKDELQAKVVFLNTSGAFHTQLMSKAVVQLEEYMLGQHIEYGDFRFPVISNVTAQPMEDTNKIHEELLRQIVNRVQWRKTTEFLMEDPEVDRFVEIAPGRVLAAMIKREYPEREVISLDTIAKVEQFVLQS